MTDTRKRFRVSVPENDTVVLDWLAAQENVGMSLRQLIKMDAAKYGIADVMCRPLDGQASVAVVRPPVAAMVEAEAALVQQTLSAKQERPAAPVYAPPAPAAVPAPAPVPAAPQTVPHGGMQPMSGSGSSDIIGKFF